MKRPDDQRLARPRPLPAQLLAQEHAGSAPARSCATGPARRSGPSSCAARSWSASGRRRRWPGGPRKRWCSQRSSTGRDRLAPVGGEAARAARDRAEDRLRRLADPERDEVAHRLHARDPATRARSAPRRGRRSRPPSGRRSRARCCRSASRSSALSESTKATISALGRADAGRHRGALAAVLREGDHAHARRCRRRPTRSRAACRRWSRR